MAISRARSAVFFATLIYLLSAASAHARPSFELTDAGARAGDTVHFSISEPGGWGVAYHLEIGGEDVLDGRQAGPVSGTFTMPYLGESAKTIRVDAELWWSDDRRRDKRRLEYLGPALPAPDPPVPAPTSTVQAVAPPTPAPAQPADAPTTAADPSPAPATYSKPRGPTRDGGKRRASETKRSAVRGDEPRRDAQRVRNRKKRDAPRKHRRSKRSRHWKGGFYTGYAEQGNGSARARTGFFALNAIAPHSVALAAGAARDGGGANAAVVVPAVLGLAAVTLAGTAVLRRRRLASRSDRT